MMSTPRATMKLTATVLKLLSAFFGLLIFTVNADTQLQQIDPTATAAIQSATTSDEYISDWVSQLPEDANVPSPRDVLGYTVGTPGKLTHLQDIYRYFYSLQKASPRVKIFSLGKSEEGREMIVAAIADEATIANIDSYRQMTNQLSDPRKTDAKAADRIIKKAKPIYWMTAGLHSTELGPPEMTMELAYRLAVQDDELFNQIRKNVIVLITPVLETDGRARQVEWYYQSIAKFTEYDNTPPKSPPFWGHYTFHDNNRDGLVFSQPLTRNYVDGFYHWKPTLSLDLHESVPLLYVSTGTGPYNTAVDPITVTEWQSIANYEVARLTAKGIRGVWTWGFYTGWYPGYLLWVTNNHNANGRFYETFGNHTAQTVERDLRDAKMAGKKVTDKTWYRAKPPKKKFKWSMRNNTNLMQSGAIASLEMVAKNPKLFLHNFYQKGVSAIARANSDAPYAYVIPKAQTDLDATNDLIKILQRHGIEISVAEENKSFDKKSSEDNLPSQHAEHVSNGDDNSNPDANAIAVGDLIITMDQPYAPLAKNLLSKQKFPKKVEVPPYDDVAWTLGLQMGVKINSINDKSVATIKRHQIATDFKLRVDNQTAAGRYLLVNHQAQNEIGPLAYDLKRFDIEIAKESFKVEDQSFNAGSLIIDSGRRGMKKALDLIAKHEIKVTVVATKPTVKADKLKLPKIGLLHSWTSTQNAGWVRYTLDQSHVPWQLVDKDRLKKGRLRRQFDVIVVPAFWGGTRIGDLIGGIDKKWSPLPYKKSARTPSFGKIASSKDITGGFGFDGMQALQDFVESGGTLIGLHSGGVVAASSGMTHKISTSRPTGLNTPGSIISTKIINPSALTYGYSQFSHVFRGNGPLYQVAEIDRDNVAMQFGSKVIPAPDKKDKPNNKEKTPPLVLSGAVLSGDKILDGAPALLSESVGKGHVVLFSWNPLHRHVNHHDHAYFYNAVLNWNNL